MKICNTCKVEKANKSFGVNNARPDNMSNICKECLSEQRKLARIRNPDVYKKQWGRNKYSLPGASENRRLLAAYGITSNLKSFMSKKTDGKCEICKKPSKLVVDHDHHSGLVRGLLCSKCNRGLGHFDDNISLMLRALRYLQVKGDQNNADFN